MSQKKGNIKAFYALSIAWQLGFLIAIPIGGFMFLGYLSDKYLGTQPLFLILGIVIGIVVTIYEVYHIIAPLIVDKTKKHD